MTNGPVDREKLYQMICALSDSDFQKAVSYVSFLRFANVSQGKILADLLKEVSKSDAESWGDGGTGFPAEKMKKEPYIAPDPVEPPYVGPDEFFAPVRSPRLEETAEKPLPVPDSFLEPEPFPLHVDPLPDHFAEPVPPDPDDMFFPEPEQDPDERRPEKSDSRPESPFPPGTGAAGKKIPASSFQPDEFFMPVRSERLANQLRKSAESEAAKDVRREKPDAGDAEKGQKETVQKGRPLAFIRPPDLPAGVPVDLPFEEDEDTPIEKSGGTAAREPEIARKPEVVQEPEPEREDNPKKEEESGEKSPKNLKEPERSWSETLMRCRSVLRLSCAEMAFLFDVSPEKFYSWFGDDGPDIEQEVLLQYCVEVAKRVEKTEIPRFDLAIRNAFSDGDSFVQKLKRQKITGEDLKILKDAAQRDEELRRRPKGATKPFHSFQDTIDLYSTPLYCEV